MKQIKELKKSENLILISDKTELVKIKGGSEMQRWQINTELQT